MVSGGGCRRVERAEPQKVEAVSVERRWSAATALSGGGHQRAAVAGIDFESGEAEGWPGVDFRSENWKRK